MASIDPRLSSPSAARNSTPILDVLRSVLPGDGLVLELASGTGEHVAALAAALPGLEFQPSDPSAEARASIAAWTADLRNVREPIDLDAAALPWPVEDIAAIVVINMTHISPWPATLGLLHEAGRLLPKEGLLYIYGPFIEAQVALAPSNAAFDADLRQRDPSWGLRDVAAIEREAARAGLRLDRIVPMPANNLSLILRRG